MFESDKKSSLERLKKSLYSRAGMRNDINERHDIHESSKSVPDTWQKDGISDENVYIPKENHKMPLHKKIFLYSMGFFFLSLGIALYSFFGGRTSISVDNIDILAEGPVSIAGGDILSLNLRIINKNSSEIKLADLIVEFPEGTKDPLNLSKDLTRSRISLGNIKASGVIEQKIDAVIFGEQNQKKSLKFTVEYRTAGSNAIFYKEKKYDIEISSSPIVVTLEGAQQVNSGLQSEIKVTVSSNSISPVKGLLLGVEYPFGFSFVSGSPSPFYSNNIFKIGDLAPGTKKVFTIKGKVLGQDGEQRFIKASVGIQSKEDEKIIATNITSSQFDFTIVKPFIGIDLALNGSQAGDYPTKPGSVVRADVTWTNNLATPISNASIEINLGGNMLDKNSVFTEGGFYSSLTNTITWDSKSVSKLEQIAPGDSGRISFTFAPLRMNGGTYPLNPEIKIETIAKGATIDQGQSATELSSSITRRVLINSEVSLFPQIFYSFASIPNSGPIPPKAEQTTTYTVVWTINNSSNSISHTQVSATIPPYVTFTKVISSDADISYNPLGGGVVWNAGSVARSAGFSGQAKTVSFQVSVTPSVTQVGQTLDIASVSNLTATDDFTGATVTASGRALTTRIDDLNANSNSGTVTQ